MRYLVMEVHPAYAVLLDQEGRFIKAANLRYQVGDRVENIVPLRQPEKAAPRWRRSLGGLVAAAACICIMYFGLYQPNFSPYGTVRLTINPDVAMTLSRTERILALEGLNGDGADLVEGYSFKGKDQAQVTDELVERAIDMGYLSDGGAVTISVSGGSAQWQETVEEETASRLQSHWGETVVIQIGVPAGNTAEETENTPPQIQPPVSVQPPVPAGPDTASPDPAPEQQPSQEDGGEREPVVTVTVPPPAVEEPPPSAPVDDDGGDDDGDDGDADDDRPLDGGRDDDQDDPDDPDDTDDAWDDGDDDRDDGTDDDEGGSDDVPGDDLNDDDGQDDLDDADDDIDDGGQDDQDDQDDDGSQWQDDVPSADDDQEDDSLWSNDDQDDDLWDDDQDGDGADGSWDDDQDDDWDGGDDD